MTLDDTGSMLQGVLHTNVHAGGDAAGDEVLNNSLQCLRAILNHSWPLQTQQCLAGSRQVCGSAGLGAVLASCSSESAAFTADGYLFHWVFNHVLWQDQFLMGFK